MATGGSSTELGSYGAKCNGSKTTLPDPVHHYNYDLHVKMSKKIAQLTKVIYALNAKSDEHEVSLQAVKEAHQEEIQHIIAETRGKILQYKSRMGEEMDLRHQIQTLEDSLQKHKKCKEEVLADFEMYKQQVVEREKNMEREHTEKIMALSKEMLDIKKEFESNLQHFMDVQHRLEQDKQSAITEMVKVNQESENLQEKCKTLKGCFDEKIKLEAKHKVEIQNLNQELEILKLEKKRLTTDFEKKVNKLQASHQKELETLKKALQLSVTETLKQWQIEQKKNLQAQEAALQLKLKKLESDMEVKCQMMNEFKNQSHKLQELLNNAQVRIQDLEKQLQKAEKKLTTSNLKLQKMEDEAELLRERLLVQEAEILHKTDENKALSLSEHNAQAEVDGLKTHLSELKHKLAEGQLQQQQNTEAEHSQQLTQVIEILSREKGEHHKRHEEELKKLKRVAEEEKLRLKEQLMKGLEELVKKHTTEIKAVQTSMELERKQLQKELQNQLDAINIKVKNEKQQLENEKEELYNKLQESLQQISRMDSLMKQTKNDTEQADSYSTNMKESHERLLQDQEQALNQISELQEKLRKQKEQHEALVSSLQKEQHKMRDQLSQQIETKWKEKVRSENDKLREQLKQEYANDKQSALAHLQQEKENEMKILQEKWQNVTVALEIELTNIKKNSQQQMEASQDALQLLQSQFGKEKEMLLEKLQCVTALNQDLKSQLQTLKEQTLKTEEKCQQHEIAEGNYQNQLKALEEDLSKSQSETSKLQRERLLLQEALSRLKKEIESSNQKTVQHRSEEAQHQKSVQEEFKAQHEKEINFLKQNHLKEIQGIVSDFSSSQTRLQAKIVSLETEVKEMEEKSKKHESKPEDLHRISTLQDKLSEHDQIIKKLLDERRFHQLAMANSESSINRCLYAGTFTPTLKKRTEDLPVRVVSVPNLSSYEKSFLSSESTPINRFPLMTKSPSLDQSLSSTSRLLNQPSQVQPSKQASSISNEKGKNKETKGKDPQRQEWFTKYFSF
ncbi:protein FAM184B-like isoform X2 [Chiloscyllium plagiosum]|uniref:protein FAM184B-like isoform X2 n=1 Tax=Chiloscyllium plagiosum TaxID=36176 RepID=UPI001CB81E6A|nr:protein FAM184B-like isoform X2 [Chiloscyllium plagiosum]